MIKNITDKIKKLNNYVLKKEKKGMSCRNNSNYSRHISDKYNINFYDSYSLPKAYVHNQNAFFTYSGFIYFYPPNDGMAKLPFYYYKDHDLVITNKYAFSEIENLDEIILEMVRMYNKALDDKIALNPYGFMLKLEDEITRDYKGKASLVLTDKVLVKNNSENRNKCINDFLDHFIGWNFGLSVNRNEELKEELIKLNNKVIEKGIREDAGPGYGVYGTETEVYNGLQHYSLPTSKEKTYKLTNK